MGYSNCWKLAETVIGPSLQLTSIWWCCVDQKQGMPICKLENKVMLRAEMSRPIGVGFQCPWSSAIKGAF